MTPTQPHPESRSAGRARVTDVSVLLLVHPQGRPLDHLLAALADQVRPAQRILVCGLDPQGQDAAEALAHPGLAARRIPVLLRPALEPTHAETDHAHRWRVVEDARASLPVHEDNWLWVLHDDSLPAPGALAALTAAVRRSSRVAMVGPKLVRDDDPRLLVGVGHQVTVAGRPSDPDEAPLVDQGQLDLRQDVLAVPLAGALVRSDLLEESGGLDAAFGADGVEGLDLGWRLHLSGHRVVVAPDAVVRQGQDGLGVQDPRRTRVRTRQVALARGSLLAALPRALGVVLTSALAALLLLLVKRPQEAADEWADVRAALSPARGWGARWRFRGRRRVRPRNLAGLFVAPGAGLRSTMDTVGAALDPRARSTRAEQDRRGHQGGTVETGPVSDELAELGSAGARRRWWSWPLAGALLAAVLLTAWQWRGLLGALRPGGQGVTAAELGPGVASAADLWRSALDPWRGGGLGHDGPAEAWLVPAAVLARLVELLPGGDGSHLSAAVALGWLLLLAVPASVLTAYLALRRATRRSWVRAGLSLGYAALLPLGAAVADGRVGPVVVHVLAPLLLAGYAVCAPRAGGSRRAAAAFATVLGVTLAAQWVPLVLVPSTLGGLALLLVAKGRARWRGAVLVVLPWALMLPWLPQLWADPVRLLGGAGGTVVGVDAGTTPAWALALLHPDGPVDAAALGSLPLWSTAPLWLAALLAVVLRGPHGRRAGVLVGAALVTLTTALVVDRLAVGVLPAGHVEAGQVVSVWPGTLLSLTGAALLLASAILIEHLLALVDRYRRTSTTEVPRSAGALVVAATVLAVTLPATGAVAALWQVLDPRPTELAVAVDPLPAVAAEQGRGPSALRTLSLVPDGTVDDVSADDGTADDVTADDGTTDDGTADDVASDGPGNSGTSGVMEADLIGTEPEPARMLRDRVHDLAGDAAGRATDPLVDPVADPVADLVIALTGGASGEEVLAELQRQGVGFVHLHAPEDERVVPQIDRVPGLTRVSSPEGEVLWRLPGQDAARVRVVDADGTTLGRLDATGPHGRSEGRLQELPEGAELQVSEGLGWAAHAVATVDEAPVEVTADGRVALPAGDHEVSLAQRSPALPWHLVAGILALVTAFLALPFGRAETEETPR